MKTTTKKNKVLLWIIFSCIIFLIFVGWIISHLLYPRNSLHNRKTTISTVIVSPSPINGKKGKIWIQNISPASGPFGTQVTLHGSGFSLTNNTVWFDHISINFDKSINSDENAIHFSIPSTLTEGCVQTLDDYIKGSPGETMCNAIYIANVSTGIHTIIVTNQKREVSNQVSFTITR